MSNLTCAVGKDYLPASFNGIPFHCVEATSEHGRRGAEGEFPFGESTSYADLGRRIRQYTLTAEFRDDNHVLQAAALIAACELPGPGILVHPTRGIVSAACRSIKVSDRMEEEAGITYIDLDFVEGNAWPNGLSLVGVALGLFVGTIFDASRASFVREYHPRTLSIVHRGEVVDTAQGSVGQIAHQYSIAITQSTDARKWSNLSDLREVEVNDVIASDPVIADRAISLGMNALSLEISGQNKFDVFRTIANWAADQTTLPSIAGDQQNAVLSHTRILSAAYMAQGAAEIGADRIDNAFNNLDRIVAIIVDEMSIARLRCDDTLYLALADFKIQVEKTLYATIYQLPPILAYNFNAGVLPVAAAYAIYKDAKRHRDLEIRNIVDVNGRIGPTVIATTT